MYSYLRIFLLFLFLEGRFVCALDRRLDLSYAEPLVKDSLCEKDNCLLVVGVKTEERLCGVAERAGVSISLDGERVHIAGNRQILEEIVYNLVDNGIKYNREGGFVRISLWADGERAILSVKDNGIGIPEDKQDRIFERFYRVDKSHSKSIGGTGLGLSIVKHAAAYHDARITLNSTENVGTEIKIEFRIKAVSK